MRLSVRRRLKMRKKRTASRHFSRGRRNSHCIASLPRFLKPLEWDQIGRIFDFNQLFKQVKTTSLNKWSSIAFAEKKTLITHCCIINIFFFFVCFYTEKKTLRWVPPAVMTFVQVTFTYPEFPKKEFDPFLWEARRKGILTLFLFSKVGMILVFFFFVNHPFLTNLDLLQGRLTRC